MRRFVGVALLAAAVVSCGSSSKGAGSTGDPNAVTLMAGFNPGPAPDPSKGFQIIMPIVDDIEPGASVEYCTYTNMILPQDVWINETDGFQTETGHHVVLYYATNPQPVDTHVCATEEMAEFQFGMPAAGGAGESKIALPGNLAVHLPAGSQMVVDHHYLNASAVAVPQAQSAINVLYADPTIAHTTSSTVVVLDSQLTVPVGASTYTEDCTVDKTYAAWDLIPHMHAWGTHITVTDTNAAGVKTLFNMDWDPTYTFDLASISTTPGPSAPFLLNPGDKIHIECDYLNTTNATLTFGDEMCVLVTFTVDTENLGNLDCDRGQWGKF